MPIDDEDFKNLDEPNENEGKDDDEEKGEDDDEEAGSEDNSRCYLNPAEVESEAFESLGIGVNCGSAIVEFWRNPNDYQLIATVRYVGYGSPEPGATDRVDDIPMRLGRAVYRDQRKLSDNLEPDLDSAVFNWLAKADQETWVIIRRNNKPV